MPTRNLSFQSSLGGSDLIKIRDLSHPEDNVFDEEFHADMDMKDWNEWMQQNEAAQLDSPMIDRRLSSTSTVSWLEGTTSAVEKPVFVTPSPFMNNNNNNNNNNEFSFEDALLDFDDVPAASYAMPMGSNSISSSTTSSMPTSQDLNKRMFPMSTSLTEAERRCLTDIAMPYHILNKATLLTKSLSDTTSSSSTTSSSLRQSTTSQKQNKRKSLSPSYSPEPEEEVLPAVTTRKSRNTTTAATNKKRKSVSSRTITGTDDAESRHALCQSRKTGHNMIEKRYRTNLNEKIDCLRQSVPAFPRRASANANNDSGCEDVDGAGEDGDENGEEGEGNGGGNGNGGSKQKYGKAAILTRALEYIHHLENTTQRLGGEVEVLKERVGAFEMLAMGGRLDLGISNGGCGNGGFGGGSGGIGGNGGVNVKMETLESIREDFKQVRPKDKERTASVAGGAGPAVSGPAAAATRRRNSRLNKGGVVGS